MDTIGVIRELIKANKIVYPEQRRLYDEIGWMIDRLECEHAKAMLEDKIENLGLEGLS